MQANKAWVFRVGAAVLVSVIAACNLSYYEGFSLAAKRRKVVDDVPVVPPPPPGWADEPPEFVLGPELSSPGNQEEPRAVAWGEAQRRWVLAGDSGTVYYSDTNGADWIQAAGVNLGSNALVKYGGDVWVGGGGSDSSNDKLYYSTNGTEWTEVYGGPTKFMYSSEQGRWVALGKNGAGLTSTDGRTWTNINAPNFGDMPTIFCYGGGQWIVRAGTYATSSNGSDWESDLFPDTLNFSQLYYRNGLWLGVLFDVRLYCLETPAFSGINDDWEPYPENDGTIFSDERGSREFINAITFNANRFIATSYNGSIAWSADGKAWTRLQSPFGDNLVTAIGYGNGRWIFVSETWQTAFVSDP